MIEVQIDPSLVERARAKADEMGKIAGSFTDGEGTVAGFIGELIVADAIGAVSANTYDFDLLYDGVLLEVKTKRCSSAPKPDYSCDVGCRNLRQKADFYVFCRVLNDYSVGWLLGVIGKYDFLMNAKHHEKGSHSFGGGFTYIASCMGIPISKLHPFEELDLVVKTRKEIAVSP